MHWQHHYLPQDKTVWQGREDSPANTYFFQLITLCDLRSFTFPSSETLAFGLVGFCCDEGIKRNHGRSGASEGPAALRQALATLPIQRKNILCYDVGNIRCVEGDLENAQQALGEVVALLLKENITPIVLGGGHEVAYGHYLGLAHYFQDTDFAILNFDAHFDLRPLLPDEKGSSGTPFLQIAKDRLLTHRQFNYYCLGIQKQGNSETLFDTANHYQTQTILAEVCHQEPRKAADFIDNIIHQHERIYFSLCLDVIATPYAPGVSAPQILGLTPWQILPHIKKLASSKKIISYDIAELSPKYDSDQRTAKLAAHFVQDIIHHHARKNS